MDYKKKYEEAERLYRTANADQRYVLESLFPKLRESEDERIRKEIIRYLKRRLEISSSIPAAIGSWIAWLEKQGESYTKKDIADLNEFVKEYSFNIPSDIYNLLPKEKQSTWINEIESAVRAGVQWHKQRTDKVMTEGLRTEYEKGRADVIADTLSWLENCWPRYCSNQTIIEGFKEAIKGE